MLEGKVRLLREKGLGKKPNKTNSLTRQEEGILSTMWKNIQKYYTSLSNSRRHLPNADVIADVKSKIIELRRHFFADVIFSATSKVQNYQNKIGEKDL